MKIVEREKGVSRRNGGFDEGYQLMVKMVLLIEFLGLASGNGGGGSVHGGTSGGSLVPGESSGGHGEQGRGAHTVNAIIVFVNKNKFFFFFLNY